MEVVNKTTPPQYAVTLKNPCTKLLAIFKDYINIPFSQLALHNYFQLARKVPSVWVPRLPLKVVNTAFCSVAVIVSERASHTCI